uniref:Zinc metalloproteinase n=1 Tax=Angiostrongylus costaricensis TaxID=334426 RepID=A0A0R3PI12_ANGCS
MRVIIFAFLVTIVRARILESSEARAERSEDGFEVKAKERYNLLRNERNADGTMKFLEQLHNMEKEISNELTLSLEQNAELLNEMKNYVEIKKDHIQPLGDTIEEINHNSKVDTALFQGDMILTKEQVEEMMEGIEENKSNRIKRQAYRDKSYPKTLWSNGVYYSFYSNATLAAKRVFKKAAETWQRETCINFFESNTAPDRILVINEDGCWSNVGRVGGVQALSLGGGCESVGTAAHEIGHALGFFHTQSRHDRDDFITLLTKNFLVILRETNNINSYKRKDMDGWLSQFTKESKRFNYNYNLTYDYGSVMHYGATGVSKNGEPVMIPRDMKYIQTLGSPIISFYDKLMMNLHYKCLSMNAPPGSKIEVVLDGYPTGFAIDGCEYAGVEIKTGSDKRHTGYRFCAPENVGTSLVSTHNIVPVITYSNRARDATTVLRYRISRR